MTFQDLWTRWPWRAIRDCPGRFVLGSRTPPLSFDTLIGSPCTPATLVSAKAKDPIFVWPLQDGGLISYEQPDGNLIHTLNTAEGFSRKLQQLGIDQ